MEIVTILSVNSASLNVCRVSKKIATDHFCYFQQIMKVMNMDGCRYITKYEYVKFRTL